MRLEQVRTRHETRKTLERMQQVTEKGVKTEDIRRVYKVLADEDFPHALVHRLVNNPGQLLELYGSWPSPDNLLKVLRFLHEAWLRSDLARKSLDGAELDAVEEALFEVPDLPEQLADGRDLLEDLDGRSLSDLGDFHQLLDSHPRDSPPASPDLDQREDPSDPNTLQLVVSAHELYLGEELQYLAVYLEKLQAAVSVLADAQPATRESPARSSSSPRSRRSSKRSSSSSSRSSSSSSSSSTSSSSSESSRSRSRSRSRRRRRSRK